MASSTCWFCERVKGKRSCPARGGALICSRCCGQKRRIEIQCPEDCPYLHGGDPRFRTASQQKDEALVLAPFFALGESRAAVLFFVHHVLLSSPATARLGDVDLEDVLTTVRRTLETRTKGLLYTHPPGSAHLEPVVDWLDRVLAEREKIAGVPEASDAELLSMLDVLVRSVGAHRSQGVSGRRESYLETAGRLLAESLSQAPPLELPAELGPPPANERVILPP